MPLYEFRCPNGHDFEKFYRSISSAPQAEVCPECGEPAERRISAAGLVFKGSGFYITDYGKDGKKDLRAASKPAESKTESKSETPKTESSPAKAESKPEAKPASPKKAE